MLSALPRTVCTVNEQKCSCPIYVSRSNDLAGSLVNFVDWLLRRKFAKLAPGSPSAGFSLSFVLFMLFVMRSVAIPGQMSHLVKSLFPRKLEKINKGWICHNKWDDIIIIDVHQKLLLILRLMLVK